MIHLYHNHKKFMSYKNTPFYDHFQCFYWSEHISIEKWISSSWWYEPEPDWNLVFSSVWTLAWGTDLDQTGSPMLSTQRMKKEIPYIKIQPVDSVLYLWVRFTGVTEPPAKPLFPWQHCVSKQMVSTTDKLIRVCKSGSCAPEEVPAQKFGPAQTGEL